MLAEHLYPFRGKTTSIGGFQMHYLDEGQGRPVLMVHGNPTWSYLHRHMIGPLAATGRRVIAVDLVGHGRSDKPASKDDYTLARHVDWMSQWLTE